MLASIAETDRTTWTYDEPTGLLLKKTYADGNGPTYTYTTSGQLKRRTWARGDTTSYSYDPNTNQLAQVTSTSPDRNSLFHNRYSYDRAGNLIAVGGPTGKRTFTRDPFGRELTETLPNGRRIEREYDLAANRLSHVTLIDPTNQKVHQTGYDWNPSGTLATVTSGAGKFGYAYHRQNPELLVSLTARPQTPLSNTNPQETSSPTSSTLLRIEIPCSTFNIPTIR